MIQKTASKRSSNRRFLYGPVPSRRLGYSLGIDLIPLKTCTYNCVYCQLGKTTNQTVKQKRYVQPDKVLKELSHFLNLKTRIDYITLSGSGEPTLNSGIGMLIRKIKRITKIPVAVVTNSSIIYKNNVQKNLLNADVIMPTLTSVQERTFKRIHRPAPGITAKLIIDGLTKFRKKYKGKIWLEIMIIKGINDSKKEIVALKKVIHKIQPDKIQLNTVVRPPTEEFASPISRVRLNQIKKVLGRKCEVIAEFKESENFLRANNKKTIVLQYLQRRPGTLIDLNSSLGINQNELIKYLNDLMRTKKVIKRRYRGKIFYEAIKNN